MGCFSPFKLKSWVDIRISHGENGSFLFLNNYQDDPVETTIEYRGKLLFNGHPARQAARGGLILPLRWQVKNGITIDYLNSEVAEIHEDGEVITVRTGQDQFDTEMTLKDYRCDDVEMIEQSERGWRVQLHGKNGVVVLRKIR
jgi:hypothetical protein